MANAFFTQGMRIAHKPSKRNGLGPLAISIRKLDSLKCRENIDKSILKHKMQSRNGMITKANRNTNEGRMALFTTVFGLDALLFQKDLRLVYLCTYTCVK